MGRRGWGTVLAVLVGCGLATPTRAETEVDPGGSQTTVAEEASVYDLGLRFVDHRGRSTTLARERGRPVVIAMFYGTCTSACPLIVARIKALDASIPEAVRSKVRYLMVTFDPERDTPDALQTKVEQHALDSRWSLLVGDDDATRQIAAALGVKYRRRPDGDFDHSSGLVVLDAEGVIRARTLEVGDPIDALGTALVGAAQDR